MHSLNVLTVASHFVVLKGSWEEIPISELVAVVTSVMMGVQWSWVHTEEEGHWLALVQRPSHQPHSVTRDAIRQEVQVVS